MSDRDKAFFLMSLEKAIEEWTETVSESPEWERIGYFPADTEALMAMAAINVLDIVSRCDKVDRG